MENPPTPIRTDMQEEERDVALSTLIDEAEKAAQEAYRLITEVRKRADRFPFVSSLRPSEDRRDER
jgi:hypothetical protein